MDPSVNGRESLPAVRVIQHQPVDERGVICQGYTVQKGDPWLTLNGFLVLLV